MINLTGRTLALAFDPEAGRLASINFKGEELLSEGGAPSLIRARFRDRAGKPVVIDAAEAKSRKTEARPDGFRLVCTGFEAGDFTLAFEAAVTEEGGFLFRAETACGGDYVAEWVEYPRLILRDVLKGAGGDGEVLWPYNEGVIIDDLVRREETWSCFHEPEYPSQGLYGMYPNMVQSQFLAFLTGGGGFYLGAHDARFGPKAIDVKPDEAGFQLLLRVYTGGGFGEAWRSDFDVTLVPFEGDWHGAAELYRAWFERNKPAGLLPIPENPGLPAWYGASPVVVTYPVRGQHDMDVMTPNRLFPYKNALPYIDELAERLGAPILVILMHWEGTAPWAPPFVWPPFGGKAMLDEFADALHASGNLLGLYCSGLGFTVRSNLVESFNLKDYFREHGMAEAMCLSPEGELPLSAICTGQRSSYDMCPGSEKTVAIMEEEVGRMLESAVDYIQVFDQNHGGGAYLCYAKNHAHGPVPGPLQTAAMRNLQAVLKKKAGKTLLGCESGAADPFLAELPFSDNRFNFNFNVGRPVPLYGYLYHEYLNNFMGNQCCTCFEPDETNLLYRIAYSFVAGDMLTLVLADDGGVMQWWGGLPSELLPDREAVLTLTKNLNRWRSGKGKPYLHLGRMVAPAPIGGEKENRYTLAGGRPFFAERLLTSRWQAADGSLGQIVVNYNREPAAFTLPGEAGSPRLLPLEGEPSVLIPGEPVRLPPLSACLLVW